MKSQSTYRDDNHNNAKMKWMCGLCWRAKKTRRLKPNREWRVNGERWCSYDNTLQSMISWRWPYPHTSHVKAINAKSTMTTDLHCCCCCCTLWCCAWHRHSQAFSSATLLKHRNLWLFEKCTEAISNGCLNNGAVNCDMMPLGILNRSYIRGWSYY